MSEPVQGPNNSGENSVASTACVCGHAPEHHTRRDSEYAGLMADYRVVWRCGWTGCGCPDYVQAARSESGDGRG